MPKLMRCIYCGVLQDEPQGAKVCIRCGGELAFQTEPPPDERASYLQVQMELDQVMAPAGRNVERHLLITIRTPQEIPPAQRAQTKAGRPPLGFSAVLDVSGSMQGQKLQQAKEAVRQALARLLDGDMLSLVTFSEKAQSVLEPTAVNDGARRVVESALQEIRAGGRTALCGGLEEGLKRALASKQDTELVLLLSDGQANVGETDVEKVGYRAFQAREKGLIVSTIGVGLDYNEALMVEIATQGGGRFYHVQGAGQISAYLSGELGEVADLAARDVKIQLRLPAGTVVMPLSAAYPAQQDGSQASLSIGDIPRGTELEIPLRVSLPAQTVGAKLSFEGELIYRSPADNHMKATLNRVTVRFVQAPAFSLRDGVVVPVVERVLEHRKAASVLGLSRAVAKSPANAAHEAQVGLEGLRAYASLLGEERAEAEAQDAKMQFGFLQSPASAPQAKAAVHAAFSRHRSTKDFDKGGSTDKQS
jgi:Ca-activated chloride channel family protein